MPTHPARLHQLSLRLPVHTLEQLRALAAKEQEGIAVVFRRVVHRGLELETRAPRARRDAA